MHTVFTFRSWLCLLGVVLAFWISILKISKLLQNCWHGAIDITSFEKHLESSIDQTPNFCRNLVRKTVVLIYASALSRKEKWNRSILAEVTFIVSISYWRSEKKPISLYWRQLRWKMWLKVHIFVHNSL